MFKRGRHNKISTFKVTQDYHKIPKRTIRANGNVYRIFKSNIFRDVQTLYQDKASMDLTMNEIKYLASTCWYKKYQPLTIDMTKENIQVDID